MKFGQSRRSDPFLNPKSQLRLFRLVMLLGLMLIGVQWAAQGKNWKWLVSSKSQSPLLPSLAALDFKAQPEPSIAPLAPGEIRLSTLESAQQPALPTAGVDAMTELPAAWLVSMDDARLGLLRSEQAGIDQVLERVRSQSAATLQQAAERNVGFVTLNDRPGQFRGRLLGFDGTLWKLSLLSAGDPLRDGDEVYEAWLYTHDAANNPTRVLVTELPSSIKPGEQLDQQVQFSGYFIKRYGYATSTSTHVAPLFVAQTLQLLPVSAAAAKAHAPNSWGQWLVGLAVACAASGYMIWRLSRDARPPRSLELPEKLQILDVHTDAGVADPLDFDNNPPS